MLLENARAHEGLLFGEAAGGFKASGVPAPPTFIVTAEQYNRIARLVEKKNPARVRLSLKASISDHDVDGLNIIGEIPGNGKKDEIVMIGAHFDSWHTGTGATDNGAGSAVMIEVMRILKALNLKLDRTVRIGLWGGEEEGLFGSRAYVKEHFADPKTMQVTSEHGKLSGYFNLDNGSGKIRGVYLQGHEAMRPMFESWLAPFRDMGVTAVSIRNTGGTDHLSFAAVGLPGFQFIQDPLDYGTITHHSDMDTWDHAVPEDLMQASAVIATVVYQTAMRRRCCRGGSCRSPNSMGRELHSVGPSSFNRNASISVHNATFSSIDEPIPCPAVLLVRNSTGWLVPLACRRAAILRDCMGSTRASLSPVVSRIAGYCTPSFT